MNPTYQEDWLQEYSDEKQERVKEYSETREQKQMIILR